MRPEEFLVEVYKLGMSQRTFAKLAGITATELSDRTNGAKAFEPIERKVVGLLQELKNLQRNIAAPVDWTNIGAIHDLLKARSDGKYWMHEEGLTISEELR
jgi:transcriptional regulator with XRE-family HTH domain